MGMMSELGVSCACISLALPSGCGSGELPEPVVEYVDQGDLCFFADEAGGPVAGTQDFVDGSKLVVTVAVPECLSMSCDVNRVAACEVQQQGAVLVVTSYLAYEPVEAAPGMPCTMDCGRLVASCESAPLAAGSYTVVLGGASHALAVPSTLDAPCP
jgi:hypothetical protein